MTTHHMSCCVCGGYAGKFEQHWNRDDEYSVCPQCVAEQSALHTPEQIAEYYGKAGVNFDPPMITHMGRRYRVLAATKSADIANAFMERTPGAAVLVTLDDGRIVIADKDDLGEAK